MFLVEGGCCLAELVGCGPQFVLLSPTVLRPSLLIPSSSPSSSPPGRATGTGALSNRASEYVHTALITAIRRYQTEISPTRRPSCRYTPTCSHYALQALQSHGVRRGVFLSLRRLLRCRPGVRGGYDPVPRGEPPIVCGDC
ncbi:MAG: membrane protein insertion efficiency factor YidD [Actinomycetota bacterium]|nr:membrane protein insertion efficiency factor YidD [Actinomycetota bacterium]